ncbi:hypothetical protein DDE74_24615 [Streptomyces lydicus]|uniref:Ricin B lectin domain-containing protein n=2 Tax=Streptomyces lydicus TaxID=47763 RepID=A0A3Q9K3S4_9ACTN|nr:hypothetical protein DDE74_24615 [Streptomyces lydicus]
MLAVCASSLAIVASPLATGTARADSAEVTLQSMSTPAKYLDHWDEDFDSNLRKTDTPTSWELDFNQDGTFHIKNKNSGQCVDKFQGTRDPGFPRYKAGYLLQAAGCHAKDAQDPASDTQNWYLSPVHKGGEGNLYYLVNASDNRCLDDHRYNGDVGQDTCQPNRVNQQFTLGTTAQDSTFFHQKAVAAAFKRCETDTNSCTYEAKSYGEPRTLDAKCVSTPWHNTSKTKENMAHYQRAKNDGWQRTIGTTVTIGTEFGVDAGVVQKMTASVATTYQNTWTHWETIGESWDYPVSPQHYGWVERVIEQRDVTGNWTFSSGPLQWSAEGTSPVTYASMYQSKDEPAPPAPGACTPLS